MTFDNSQGRSGRPRRALFLDRDGVLIENRADYVRSPADVAWIPNAIDGARQLQSQGYQLVIVTNQAAVGKGILTMEQAETIAALVVTELAHHGICITQSYLCPHVAEAACDCRKPQPGMLLRAMKEFNLDPRVSAMVGDAWSDVQAANAAGVRPIMVRTGRGLDQLMAGPPVGTAAVDVVESLAEAAELLRLFAP